MNLLNFVSIFSPVKHQFNGCFRDQELIHTLQGGLISFFGAGGRKSLILHNICLSQNNKRNLDIRYPKDLAEFGFHDWSTGQPTPPKSQKPMANKPLIRPAIFWGVPLGGSMLTGITELHELGVLKDVDGHGPNPKLLSILPLA